MADAHSFLTPAHLANWYGGWSLLLAAILVGIFLGLRFHDDNFWGGYTSFRRRIARLGHVALAALGIINVVFGISPWPHGLVSEFASACLLAGATAMPAVCFLTAWRPSCRHLFPVPVTMLVAAVVLILLGGSS